MQLVSQIFQFRIRHDRWIKVLDIVFSHGLTLSELNIFTNSRKKKIELFSLILSTFHFLISAFFLSVFVNIYFRSRRMIIIEQCVLV